MRTLATHLTDVICGRKSKGVLKPDIHGILDVILALGYPVQGNRAKVCASMMFSFSTTESFHVKHLGKHQGVGS